MTQERGASSSVDAAFQFTIAPVQPNFIPYAVSAAVTFTTDFDHLSIKDFDLTSLLLSAQVPAIHQPLSLSYLGLLFTNSMDK